MSVWTVWGDSRTPVAEGLSEEEMRMMVDGDKSFTLYGVDENDNYYEGPEEEEH